MRRGGKDSGDVELAMGPAVGPVEASADDKPLFTIPRRPNFVSRFLFLFIDPVIRYGHKHTLEPENLWTPDAVDTAPLYKMFDDAWRKQLLRPEPDIRRAVVANSRGALIYTGLLYTLSMASQLVGPLMLQRIVGGLTCWGKTGQRGGVCPTEQHLYYYLAAIALAPLVQSLAENHQMFVLNVIGTKMRNALMAAIYRKCLRLSNSAMQSESTGRVVTLMSNDAQKVQEVILGIHVLWGAPALIVVILILLYAQVGWATFVGLAVMLIYTPMSTKVSRKLVEFRRVLMKWTDTRVGLMNEIINGMQMIKFYAWEGPFRARVEEARANEARTLKQMVWWQALFALLLFSGPVAMAVFCFGSWGLAGHTFAPASAYTALALFNLLRLPLAFLPMMVTALVNALVALNRIGDFLQKPESGSAALEGAMANQEGVPVGAVKIADGVFVWDETAEEPSLKDVNIDVPPGSLTMVVGGVGSGKSSVLSAVIGQMERTRGDVAVGGRVAYVAQTAWIINDSVQENIILGSDFDAERYRMAVEVSQLVADLEMLPNADATEIGDRGVTLSGGQKQRVSIARAVYSDADVYLLDDPLSAVDSHVGRALFEHCINGVLRDKTVVLVTNALQYLPLADHVVWMEGGAVRAQGTYQDLVAAGLNIAQLVHLEHHDDDGGDDTAATSDFPMPAVQEEPAPAGAGAGKAPPVPRVVSQGALRMRDAAAAAGGGLAGFAAAPTPHASRVAARRAARGAYSWSPDGKPSRALSLVRLQAEANRNLTGVEARDQGSVSGTVISTYIKAGGGWLVVALIVFLMALEQGTRVFTDTWLGFWASNLFHRDLWFYLGVYAACGVGYSIVVYFRSLRFLYTTVDAALSLHNQLLTHLLRLPKAFFDTNTAGRILNRFSRDTEVMDTVLSQSMVQFCNCFVTYISILIVISIATKWFAIAILPITVTYVVVQRYYIPAARELQRIESISRSPIYSKFSEALQGVATIRAYGKGLYFTHASDALMQENAYAYVTQRAAAAWLAMRLDLIGLIILVLAAVLAIRGAISPNLAGLCLVYALDLTRFLKHGTAMASKTESDLNSVERVVQYLEPSPEAPAETDPAVEAALPKDWPAGGAISVSKLELRYRPGLPLVLRGVSFEVAAGEKVGLVGRTGSGKSSLLLALFRMVEPEAGTIFIDGVDIRTLGLFKLRSAMSIIPQDPFMFSGDIRRNLDPFGQHDDAALWQSLEDVSLKPAIEAMEGGLQAKVVDNGGNFSLGQKQLLCMARAMLRRSRVLMLDEATASVDPETDALIQATIRKVFHDCTMFTIAHRLNTIMDSDRVLVLDAGRVVEDGEPHLLLSKDEGLFTGMVAQTGASSNRYLRDVARDASFSRRGSATGSSSGGGAPPGPGPAALRGAGSVVLGAPYFGPDSAGTPGGAAAGALRRAAGALPVLASGDGDEEEADAGAAPAGPRAYVRTASVLTNPLGAAMNATENFERELSELRHAAAGGELQRLARRGSGEALGSRDSVEGRRGSGGSAELRRGSREGRP